MFDIYPKLKYVNVIGEKLESNKELSIVRKSMKDFSKNASDISNELYSNESFGIIIEREKVEIYCDSDRAFYYGVLTLKQLKDEDKLYNSIIFDYPHMKIRGIIEGFYGEPWTLERRCEAIETISRFKMNTYIYAPKNDLYHRIKWSEPYPKDELQQMKELFEYCSNRYIDFYYTLGPGVSIKYASKEHLRLLINKYMQLYEIGVRNFGILFDDIPLELVDEKDKKVFATADTAHAYIVNELYEYLKALDSSCSLIVCGSVYCGKGNEPYIVNLCRNLPKEVNIFWTGRSICSQELDFRDAIFFLENNFHKPVFWDNYPVNDAEMEYEMHLGPIVGRDGELYKFAEGLVSNVMEYKEASMIPVITAADYLWNSLDYSSDDSLKRGILEVAGEKDFQAFSSFNKFCLKSCLNGRGNEEFIEKIVQFQYEYNEGRAKEAFDNIEVYFTNNLKAALALEKSMENTALRIDVLKWLKKFIAFNKLWIRVIRCAKEFKCGSKLQALAILLPIPIMLYLFNRNPIRMMNFETKVLIDAILK